VGQVEDEIRIDAEDALGGIDGLEVRRMFSGWGFYQRGLLFAAAWEGEFRFRTRQDGHWIYEAVDRAMLDRPDELVLAARGVLAKLEAEPAARPRQRRRKTIPASRRSAISPPGSTP
jgi:TfoX/Sxy family transcriptional regulator of competence genes